MQIYNLFLLLLSSVFVLIGGVFARHESKARTVRTVAGITAPMLILTALCLMVEMIVAGYEQTARLASDALSVKNYLFPRNAFTAIIIAFILITAASLFALKKREKINTTLAFSVLSAVTVITAGVIIAVCFAEDNLEHSGIVAPIAVIFALSEIFALADTLLDSEKKLRRIILYAVNIIYFAVVLFLLWFAYSAGFADEMAVSGGQITVGAVIFIAAVVIFIAGPVLISLLSLVAGSIGNFKYSKKA